RKTLDCLSRPSTNVVLPWSTWATMAMLRRCCWRVCPPGMVMSSVACTEAFLSSGRVRHTGVDPQTQKAARADERTGRLPTQGYHAAQPGTSVVPYTHPILQETVTICLFPPVHLRWYDRWCPMSGDPEGAVAAARVSAEPNKWTRELHPRARQ